MTGPDTDSLSTHIAVLDEAGRILAVNASWREFARANGAEESAVALGVDYLRACDDARGAWAEGAADLAAGVREALAGGRNPFELECSCHAPDRRRWFDESATWGADSQTQVPEPSRIARGTVPASMNSTHPITNGTPRRPTAVGGITIGRTTGPKTEPS